MLKKYRKENHEEVIFVDIRMGISKPGAHP